MKQKIEKFPLKVKPADKRDKTGIRESISSSLRGQSPTGSFQRKDTVAENDEKYKIRGVNHPSVARFAHGLDAVVHHCVPIFASENLEGKTQMFLLHSNRKMVMNPQNTTMC